MSKSCIRKIEVGDKIEFPPEYHEWAKHGLMEVKKVVYQPHFRSPIVSVYSANPRGMAWYVEDLMTVYPLKRIVKRKR